MILAVIVGMGAIVFLNHYLFLEPRLPFRLSQGTRDLLSYAVPGMLTAICGPVIFLPGQTLSLSVLNPYLLGGFCTMVLMLWTGQVLTSVLVSMGCFYLFRSML
ncbi:MULTISPECIES: AzlD domain-containing protein [unclassified Pseudomonas]|uniref:AzlD domain-containing protein n=1 Tax=unclassified Pseudomonas TaxID=196821 RepID=UPI0009146B2E|nr:MULTISPECIES: AzlD domain-containing protein [unclassified Pseudomonas]SFY29087.1 Branched-chain amino acid transport protein [Pseudomonas sp. NFACC47-1]SFY42741.1 Branched-chain amino acid transport protein [Pseudomonas sp. NFACC43]